MALGLTLPLLPLRLSRWNAFGTLLAAAGLVSVAAGVVALWVLSHRPTAPSGPRAPVGLKVLTVIAACAVVTAVTFWFTADSVGWLAFGAMIPSMSMATRWADFGWQRQRRRTGP
ncbi:hypothetical protein [Nakamurella endophytica]|uniref:Uncharacterized protein n=1 Tax=Nakamurella endophytica TaxID=1748367 RepID=A0A917TBV1_9ACTN|nr:hypothetical protein [Nakamurella endophytica]GGM17220.1 hypothetical protein GCM10011594_41610 [Nakamurella endophytica]